MKVQQKCNANSMKNAPYNKLCESKTSTWMTKPSRPHQELRTATLTPLTTSSKISRTWISIHLRSPLVLHAAMKILHRAVDHRRCFLGPNTTVIRVISSFIQHSIQCRPSISSHRLSTTSSSTTSLLKLTSSIPKSTLAGRQTLTKTTPAKQARHKTELVLTSQMEAGSATNAKTITSRAERSATDARRPSHLMTPTANQSIC